jgi:hypothetical protein
MGTQFTKCVNDVKSDMGRFIYVHDVPDSAAFIIKILKDDKYLSGSKFLQTNLFLCKLKPDMDMNCSILGADLRFASLDQEIETPDTDVFLYGDMDLKFDHGRIFKTSIPVVIDIMNEDIVIFPLEHRTIIETYYGDEYPKDVYLYKPVRSFHPKNSKIFWKRLIDSDHKLDRRDGNKKNRKKNRARKKRVPYVEVVMNPEKP